MFGSGQWTVWEGYAASKLFKGGFRSNNLDPNARHCMASAVVGLCVLSVWMSQWVVMMILSMLTRLSFGLKHGRNAPNLVVSYHQPPSV